MHVWTDLEQVPPGPSVVTVGNFDGVHLGHAQVLSRVVALAKERGARSVAVTFDPHPLEVHRPEVGVELITTVADRVDLIAELGISDVLVVNYTKEFAAQTPAEFVMRFLVSGLGACAVVVGQDIRFGKDNAGNLDTMVELGKESHFEVIAVDDVEPVVTQTGSGPGGGPGGETGHGGAAPGAHRRISSSAVRANLHAGQVDEAAAVLGRNHHVRGVVVHGEARGRKLGFPTANLASIGGMVPADGVYAGWLNRPELSDTTPGHPDVRLPAAISIGTNPTFDGVSRQVEAYVLDRTDLDLYDEHVALEFVQFLRPTQRFDGVDSLITQMHKDVDQARAILTGEPEAAPEERSASTAERTDKEHGLSGGVVGDDFPGGRVGTPFRPAAEATRIRNATP